MSSVRAVRLSSEMAEMRATRSYFDWSYSVMVKDSSKRVESPDAAILFGRGSLCEGG
jgi:hypothetical protein